uniref:Uncharacterized protein n=1 Tax=Parascaris univalens TaxID=6257 RepID=A0A915CBW6_PARUN
RLELFGLGNLKNKIKVEIKTTLLFRYVIVKINANCCPKILQIVLDALSGSELSNFVVRPPKVVKYCN